MKDVSKKCGELCAIFRKEELKMTQQQVADALNYSQENISSFENGRNSNNRIFLWYIKQGLFEFWTIDDIYRG